MPIMPFLLNAVAQSVVFAWLVSQTAGNVVAARLLHTGINFWPAIIPVLPTAEVQRPSGLRVAMRLLLALGPAGAAQSGRRWPGAAPMTPRLRH